jgi:hypothetical protein
MVETGTMPPAKRLGERRKAWDVRELDRAVDQLPAETTALGDEGWGDVDAA